MYFHTCQSSNSHICSIQINIFIVLLQLVNICLPFALCSYLCLLVALSLIFPLPPVSSSIFQCNSSFQPLLYLFALNFRAYHLACMYSSPCLYLTCSHIFDLLLYLTLVFWPTPSCILTCSFGFSLVFDSVIVLCGYLQLWLILSHPFSTHG